VLNIEFPRGRRAAPLMPVSHLDDESVAVAS